MYPLFLVNQNETDMFWELFPSPQTTKTEPKVKKKPRRGTTELQFGGDLCNYLTILLYFQLSHQNERL